MAMELPSFGGEAGDLRVLVVEDDASLSRLVELVLRKRVGHVSVARTGRQALELLGSMTFHAMTCDISLPDMSGIHVIAQARALAPTAGIVAVTGLVDVDIAVSAMKAGADDFLGKPFNPELLWHLLNKAAKSRRRQIEAEQAELYRRLAYTDALTGSPNRRFIDEFIIDAVERSQRTATALSVAYFDVDNFKLLNDVLGHEQGDAILVEVARLLAATVKEPSAYARFGGDEFVAVFPATTLESARRATEAVVRGVARLDVTNNYDIHLPTRISCGLATYRGYESPRELIAEAEDHMYLDKSVAHSVLGPALDQTGAMPGSLGKISNLKTLRGLVKAIDRRDSYTRFHSDHATRIALDLARYAVQAEDTLQALTIGGPIHDLGKIVVPDEILRKPGPLTREERRAMEEHPVVGAAITAAVTDYDTVVNIVRHHHERFDGNGYPGHIRGGEIGIATRIFILADAYSAMTTDRPYRRALTAEQAFDEIALGAGTQFDPDLAAVFCELLERDGHRRSAA